MKRTIVGVVPAIHSSLMTRLPWGRRVYSEVLERPRLLPATIAAIWLASRYLVVCFLWSSRHSVGTDSLSFKCFPTEGVLFSRQAARPPLALCYQLKPRRGTRIPE